MKAVRTSTAVLDRGQGPWRKLGRALGVDLRPGEGGAAVLLFLCFFLFITFQYATKSVRQSTFINSQGAARLPFVYLGLALLSYPFLMTYSRFANRLPRHRLIISTCALIALSMVAFWWAFPHQWSWIPYALYVWISLVYVMNVSQFWAFSSYVLDARQAKRLFGFIGAGGLLGGIAGGQVAKWVAAVADTRSTFLVAAGLIGLSAALIWLVHRRHPATETAASDAAGLEKLDRAKGGLEILRQSRHLRLIAAVVVLTTVVAQIVDFQFNWAAEQATTTLDQSTAFFGNFFSIMGIAAFLFQLAFTSRIHRVLGVGFAMRVLPVSMGLGTVALFLAAGMFPAALVSAALMLKIGETGLRYSLDQATRELLFLPVPGAARVKAKAFIDVFIARGSKGLGALLLLPVTFGLMTAVQSGWLTLALILVWLVVASRLYREYVHSFRRSLKERLVDSTVPINLSDVTTLELLVQSLGSSDPRQVLHSLGILSANGRGNLVPPLLLYHDDPEVRRRTLEILAAASRHDAASLIERRLSDADPVVRAEAVRALGQLHGKDVCDLMVSRLDEGDPGVRAAAVACLASHGREAEVERAGRTLQELMSDADPLVRAEGAKAIGAVAEPQFQQALVRLLYDSDPRVVQQAIAAVRRRVERDGYCPLYVPTLVSLLQNRGVKHDAREALLGFGEPVLPALGHFLSDPDEPAWVRRALPKTISRIGGPEAGRCLVEALAVRDDPFLRRKVIEALGDLDRGTLTSDQLAAVRVEIGVEAGGYLENLLELDAIGLPPGSRLAGPLVTWDRTESPSSLLQDLLRERLEDRLRNLFGLLAILHRPEDAWAAHRALTVGAPTLVGQALEYLDNVLTGEVRRHVFAVIGDRPLDDKLEEGHRLYGAPRLARHDALRLFLERAAADGGADVGLAALYYVHTERVAAARRHVRGLVDAPDPVVAETAAWVLARAADDTASTHPDRGSAHA